MSRADKRKHDVELQRLREIVRAHPAKKSFVPGLSVEGSLGIAATILVFILDKVGVGGASAYFGLLLVAAYLCIDSVVRSEWARSNKERKVIGGGIALAFYAAFGSWLFLHAPKESETDRKLDELLASRAYNPEKLHAKYPGNYFIFEVDYQDKQNKAHLLRSTLGNYEFDFSVVKIIESTPNRVSIRLPDIKQRNGPPLMTNSTIT